jgi:tetratricopeptide (TPR) repeat protein
MEYVEGKTLRHWLKERPRSRREVLDAFLAAGEGLLAAHQAGLVHRDFKPDNVIVGNDGRVRVLDFGLARAAGGGKRAPAEAPAGTVLPSLAVDGDPTLGDRPPIVQDTSESGLASQSGSYSSSSLLETTLTRAGSIVGTPRFMAPEQHSGELADERADQFSFCVALYQALYGAYPFAGASVGELMAAVTGGQVQPPPAKSAVPPWLRRILLRGLSVEPAARWPSMQVLTTALGRDPARRRNRWLAGAAIAAAILAGAWALRTSGHAEPVCRGGPKRLAEVWETAGEAAAARPRREATRAAFIKTGLAHAEESWTRAARLVDDYAGKWLRMYRDACEATQLRGEHSAEVLDLRMTCLTDRLARVRALTDVFSEASPTVVDNAVSAASALPGLDRCADVQLLRAVVPPPDDPAARARVDVLKGDLARVKALSDSGQCAAAATAGRTLIGEAQKIGYLALEGESLTAVVRRGSECLSVDEMVRDCKRALLVGIASRDDEVAAEAAIFLAHTEADRTANVAEARDWIEVAAAVLQGMSRPHPVLDTWRLSALAEIYDKEGKGDQALESFEQARKLMERTQGTDDPDYGILLNNIGVMLAGHRRFEEALAYYRQGESVWNRTLGREHTRVGLTLGNEAEALNALHRYDEARAVSERALAVWRRAGSSSFHVAWALTSLGEALLGLGRSADAVTRLEEAGSLFGDDRSSYPHEARFALARALWARPDDRARALALARQARTGYERLGDAATQVAEVDAWLAAHDRAAPRK